jgi:hypothetical protein
MTSPDVDVLVHLMFDEIIVTLPGTVYKVVYQRIADPPGLVVKSERIPDDPFAPIPQAEFLARAGTAAAEKAREFGWIM